MIKALLLAAANASFLFVLAWGMTSSGYALGQAPKPRVWKDLSGKFSVSATFVTATSAEVSIQNEAGKVIEIPRGKLSKEDQEYVGAAETLSVMEAQQPKLEPHLAKLMAEPRSAIDLISAIQKQEPNDPLAALWCGVAYATEAGKPGYAKAEKYFDDALLRLRAVFKHFPEAHPKTLAAALNNRAVLALRERKVGRAVQLFKELATISPQLTMCAGHNMQLILSIGELPQSSLEMAASEKRLLVELASKIVPPAIPNLPQRFLYSTEFDTVSNAPPIQLGGSLELQLKQQQIWPELTCFACYGTGMIDCANCVAGVTKDYTSEQVAFNRINQTPVMAPKVIRVRCNNCSGNGGFKCPHCDRGRLSLEN